MIKQQQLKPGIGVQTVEAFKKAFYQNAWLKLKHQPIKTKNSARNFLSKAFQY